ncbi:pyridoxine/pyridoxamine 5'-phosphate oxidase-like [Aphidius gifuensis]|uniref:pyridoxine/pyridoxamine 5'-phosphate oxidase-like n=1 Tax=Aphidius gifuensis TaxID=684658 RepID=UPI001CDC49EE|nr:pyridoxine/pyridoxamine 5'-phosphate oxidase-like [Aphidius gifuensis]
MSGLSHINLKSDDPFDLFSDWCEEIKKSSDNKPRSRNVVLEKWDKNGFLFTSDNRSRLAKEIANNNSASICIFWKYKNEMGETILRQIRIEGHVEELARNEVEKIYEAKPLYAKIRSHLCHQDAVVDWNQMKKQHDELLKKVEAKEISLAIPDHFVGYKVVPTWMEFYDSKVSFIADRLEFIKNINDDT